MCARRKNDGADETTEYGGAQAAMAAEQAAEQAQDYNEANPPPPDEDDEENGQVSPEAAEAARLAAGERSSGLEPPPGFSSARRQQADGFWVKKNDAVIYGQLLDRYSRKGERGELRYSYLVKLIEPTLCKVDTTPKNGKEKIYSEKTLLAGATVSVDETADLAFQLKPLIEADHYYDVWIHCIDKIPIPNSKQKMWRMDVQKRRRGLKADKDR